MKRTRGRPRKFDETEVKTSIMREFWQKGFSATSLDDLATATGLTRPSLYGAFGDKLSMYLLAIDFFGEMMRERAGTVLMEGKTIEVALKGFFTQAIDIYLGEEDAQSYGCLVYTTAITESVSHPEIQDALKQTINNLEKAFHARITKLLPDIRKSRRDIIVSLAVSTVHTLAIRARAGASRSDLLAIVKQNIKGITAVAQTD